ncbi:hypothetical protein ACFYTQ_07660 [Nocardia sp. NPDC004068]|uniref:hypothetical protein n=1 Tax=Nocardia sp. NPDC004068 TaxID=3364303 RepID=UPI0036A52EC7
MTLDSDTALVRLTRAIDATDRADEIEEVVRWVLESDNCPSGGDIVRYLAFRYRWSWLADDLHRNLMECVKHDDLRGIRWYEWMLEAFDDAWEDIEFYPSLRATHEEDDRHRP